MKTYKLCLLTAVLTASGCATMNPYVQHSRHVSQQNITACALEENSLDTSLKYACSMAIRMEQARSQIISTRSGLTATIFPLVGIIGYNSARGINAPTNAAMSAGGFAGYSAISTLAQPDRIRVYDNGLRSTYCAIGVYGIGIASEAPQTLPIMMLIERIKDARAAIKLVDDTDHKTEVQRLNLFVNSIEKSIPNINSNRRQSAQLRDFILATVAKVNSQLTLTVPDNKQIIGNALDTIMQPSASIQKMRDQNKAQMPLKSNGNKGAPEEKAIILNNAIENVNDVIDLYWSLAENHVNSTKLDFTSCTYADLNDVDVRDSIARFMFGPNDSYSGKVVTLSHGNKLPIVISGGIPPYTVAVIGDDNSKVNASISNGLLTIEVVSETGQVEAASYQIVVNDATNRNVRSMQINVPDKN